MLLYAIGGYFMAYFLKKSIKSRGLYLQIYESFRDKERKCSAQKSFKALGYFDDLVASGIGDPISYFQQEVDKLNMEHKEMKIEKISNSKKRSFNVGYFLLKSLISKLNVNDFIDIMTAKDNFQYPVSSLINNLIYARVISPCSKAKTVETVFDKIFENPNISLDQVYEGISYIGNDYKKYIDIYNHQISKAFGRKTDTVYFDCTNYYFEIDIPKDDKQKGPSKENRSEPIIGQALLLDANQIPIGMEMYPGNESEKPYIRKLVSDMKQRYKVEGKTVQVADKGLNCAANIIEALKNGDGYVFSKSIHGKNLSDVEKKWVLLDKGYAVINDTEGKPKYKIKECIDIFTYKLDGKIYKVKEKRVVSYNYDLARKQQTEIKKQVDKAASLTAIKSIQKEDYGDSVKYVNFEGSCSMNLDKIEEDLKLAGYNLIVTSELDKTAHEIYDIYHGLWRIEESFRITKSYLDARPVYLQKRESIYGHFLICYLSLVLLRLLEIKVYNNELNVSEIVDFIRDYTVTAAPNELFINTAHESKALCKIKEKMKLPMLDNSYLYSKDIKKVLQSKL